MTVVGLDGCASGWIVAVLGADRLVRVDHVPTIGALADLVPDATVAAIDIPMTFPPVGTTRAAELAARARLGARRSSIFLTAPRAVLACDTYAEANALAKATHGAGLSAQAYQLRSKILEVEEWRAATTLPAHEVHPELSFAVLLDHPARHSKKTWAGMVERRDALAAAGLEVDAVSTDAGRAAVDDVLDAVAAAWTAARIARGDAERVPADRAVPDSECIWA